VRLTHEHVFLDTGRSMTVEVVDKFNVTTASVAVAIPAARSLPEAVDLAASTV